ncbi:MAG: hypothetical protein WCP22_03750 [Chlamydiota bacterium]
MARGQKIRVQVVDDSALMRKGIGGIINAGSGCGVIGPDSDGIAAIPGALGVSPGRGGD